MFCLAYSYIAIPAATPTLTERVEPKLSINLTSWTLFNNSDVMPLFSEPKIRVVFFGKTFSLSGLARTVLFSIAINSLSVWVFKKSSMVGW